MTPLVVLSLLGQLAITPPLTAEPLSVAAPTSAPVTIVGRPALTWDGTKWGIAWRDTRRAGPTGGSHVWVTTWNGGSFVDFPHGLPIAGSSAPLVLADDLQLASTSTFSLMVFPQRSLDAGVQVTGVRTQFGPAVSGSWTPPFDLSQGSPVTTGSLNLSANGSQALVAWFSGQEVRLVSVPGLINRQLDAGPNAGSLSIGVADGGFLITWIDGSNTVNANLVDSTTLSLLSTSAPSTPNPRGVRVVSTPRERVVTTVSLGGEWRAHTYQGNTWASTSTWPNGSAIVQPLVTATDTAIVGLYRPNPVTQSSLLTADLLAPGSFSSVAIPAPASWFPVALAQDGTQATALFVERSRLAGERITLSAGAGWPIGMPSTLMPLLSAPLSQDAPSVVWVREENAFLLAWEEEQSDGGSAVMTGWVETTGALRRAPTPLTGALPVDGGVRPTLLRRLSASGYAVHVRSPGSPERSVFALTIDGGSISLGAQLAPARLLPSAVLGDQIAMVWGGNASTMGFADGEGTARLMLAGLPPVCAAQLDGGLWFAAAGSSAVSVGVVPDVAAVSTTAYGTRSTLLGPGAVCSLAVNGGTEVAMAWQNSGQLVYATTPVSGLSLRTSQLAASETEDPLLVETSAGAVMVWVAVGRGVEARLKPHDPGSVLSLGGLDVNNLAVASSPHGLAAVVWDSFVPDAGARQVMVRLLGTFDAGVAASVDAGVRDAGAVDAGVLDAGVFDAGTPDAGTPDAGTSDAGTSDASVADGGEATPDAGPLDASFVDAGGGALDAGSASDAGFALDAGALAFAPTSCGCRGAPGAFSLLLMLALLRRRSR